MCPITYLLESDEGRVLIPGSPRLLDEIVKTAAAIQIEQASAKVLLAENTETIKEIKTDTARLTRHSEGNGWRQRVAIAIRTALLDNIDPNGVHRV